MKIKSLLLASLFAVSSGHSETPSSKIAFVSLRDHNFQIYLMNPDGSEQRNLSRYPASDRHPAWSPDGARIAFVRAQWNLNDSSSTSDIFVMNWDGSFPFRLTQGEGRYGNPAWSLDGSRIYYTLESDGQVEIRGMDANTGAPIELGDGIPTPDGKGGILGLDVSPDGNTIVFSFESYEAEALRNGWLPADLYLVSVQGIGLLRLNAGLGHSSDPAWSPDGRKIAFYSRRTSNEGVFVIDANGSGLVDLSPTWSIDLHPTWSPDGRKIAFGSTRDRSNDIFVMNADGSSPNNITRGSGDANFSPVWSPVASYPTAISTRSWGEIKKTPR